MSRGSGILEDVCYVDSRLSTLYNIVEGSAEMVAVIGS